MDNIENNFHKSLEKDIDHLGKEINKVQESVEGKSVENKEVVKKTFKNITPQTETGGQESSQPSGKPAKSSDDKFLPDYMQGDKSDAETKMEVEKLMDLVIHKGILKALRESKKKPPFIQDAFHDALAEKLIPELKKRGILK